MPLDECIYSADNINRVKYAYANGHQVASHTWAHLDLATLTQDASMTTQFLYFLVVDSPSFLVASEMARTDR